MYALRLYGGDLQRRFEVEGFTVHYEMRIMNKSRSRTQNPAESLIEYIRSPQEMTPSWIPDPSEMSRVTR